MRIMFVITRGNVIGGAHVHVRDLGRRLVEDGHTVQVVVGGAGTFTDELGRADLPWVSCPHLQREISPAADLWAVREVDQLVRAFAPDLVSTHSSKAGVVGRVACRASSTPCLFTAHGWAFTEGVPLVRRTGYRWLEQLTAPLATRIICVSEHDRRLGLAAGMDSWRLVTVFNGMPDVPERLRAQPGVGGQPRIVMVARFDRQKDHATLLEAVRDLPDARLDLVGDGPRLDVARRAVCRLGLTERVRFLGDRRDVAEVLARSHIFVLTSNWEGFPRATLEAMRAGLPTIVSDVGGAGDAVAEGVSGYRVARGDVGAVRDRLSQLIGDARLRERMGQAARARYTAAFSFDRMYEQTLAVYRMVLAEHPAGFEKRLATP